MKVLYFTISTLLFFSVCSGERLRSEDDVTRQILNYVKKTQSPDEAKEFKEIIQMISFPRYLYRSSLSDYSTPRVSILCLTCRSAVNSFIKLFNDGASIEELADSATNLCVNLRIQPEHACRGIVDSYAPIFWYLLKNNLITARSFCGVLYQISDANACPINEERYEWSVTLPEKKEVVKMAPSTRNNLMIRIAQITDTHYDPKYIPGGDAVCDEVLCCRKPLNDTVESIRWRPFKEDVEALVKSVRFNDDGMVVIDIDYADKIEPEHIPREETKDSSGAGYWGDYRNCDTPWWALEDGLDHLAENQEIDYVYYTGDVVDHAIWETSQEWITESINKTFEKLKSTFKDIPVYPVIGNHESQPCNQFASTTITEPELTTVWLYELLADIWSYWLPESTRETILKGGYYTVLVKPGFRIVAINTNLCYTYNWWIHQQPSDPSGQFTWLIETLSKAEQAGEKVHILSHIPTGRYDQYYVCTREYTRILSRFSDIIIAEFNGHTHKDEFKIFYKENGTDPFAVAWNGGSLTSFSNVNLNYRIYEVEDETFDLIDAETWIYNLTEANLTPEQRPRWFKEYSFKEHYGLSSINPTEMDRLVSKMVTTDKQYLLDYQRFRGKSSDVYGNTCNDNCVKSNLCYMLRTEVYDNKKCDEYYEIYKS